MKAFRSLEAREVVERVSKQKLYDMDRLALINLVNQLQDEVEECHMLLEEALLELESDKRSA